MVTKSIGQEILKQVGSLPGMAKTVWQQMGLQTLSRQNHSPGPKPCNPNIYIYFYF